jgi:hypothetical protein
MPSKMRFASSSRAQLTWQNPSSYSWMISTGPMSVRSTCCRHWWRTGVLTESCLWARRTQKSVRVWLGGPRAPQAARQIGTTDPTVAIASKSSQCPQSGVPGSLPGYPGHTSFGVSDNELFQRKCCLDLGIAEAAAREGHSSDRPFDWPMCMAGRKPTR